MYMAGAQADGREALEDGDIFGGVAVGFLLGLDSRNRGGRGVSATMPAMDREEVRWMPRSRLREAVKLAALRAKAKSGAWKRSCDTSLLFAKA